MTRRRAYLQILMYSFFCFIGVIMMGGVPLNAVGGLLLVVMSIIHIVLNARFLYGCYGLSYEDHMSFNGPYYGWTRKGRTLFGLDVFETKMSNGRMGIYHVSSNSEGVNDHNTGLRNYIYSFQGYK